MNNIINQKIIYDINTEKEKGWYVTIHCWDIIEGEFPSTAFWTNKKFDSDLPIISYIDIRFNNQYDAEKFIEQHDLYF